MAVSPCKTADDYTTTGKTVVFGMDSMYTYSPKCLKVAAGTTVTFMGGTGQTFSDHPLVPSTERGTLTGNPITMTMDSDSSKDFKFTTKGFYAYYCRYHGVDSATAADNYMAGVIWVE